MNLAELTQLLSEVTPKGVASGGCRVTVYPGGRKLERHAHGCKGHQSVKVADGVEVQVEALDETYRRLVHDLRLPFGNTGWTYDSMPDAKLGDSKLESPRERAFRLMKQSRAKAESRRPKVNDRLVMPEGAEDDGDSTRLIYVETPGESEDRLTYLDQLAHGPESMAVPSHESRAPRHMQRVRLGCEPGERGVLDNCTGDLVMQELKDLQRLMRGPRGRLPAVSRYLRGRIQALLRLQDDMELRLMKQEADDKLEAYEDWR